MIVAIVCITVQEVVALSKGINGTMFTLTVAGIAGLAGLATKTPKMLDKVLS